MLLFTRIVFTLLFLVLTLEYRINGGGVRVIGGLEMAQYSNNRGVGIIGGGVLGEIESIRFLSQTCIIYIFM